MPENIIINVFINKDEAIDFASNVNGYYESSVDTNGNKIYIVKW